MYMHTAYLTDYIDNPKKCTIFIRMIEKGVDGLKRRADETDQVRTF